MQGFDRGLAKTIHTPRGWVGNQCEMISILLIFILWVGGCVGWCVGCVFVLVCVCVCVCVCVSVCLCLCWCVCVRVWGGLLHWGGW
jgi:hypothetical protein